jgi:hypothetical protein
MEMSGYCYYDIQTVTTDKDTYYKGIHYLANVESEAQMTVTKKGKCSSYYRKYLVVAVQHRKYLMF